MTMRTEKLISIFDQLNEQHLVVWPGAKGVSTSSYRYRIIELLDRVPIGQENSHGDYLQDVGVMQAIAGLRNRWIARYRISQPDWMAIISSIADYRGLKIRKDEQNLRRFFEAVMWVADTGANWSSLPAFYGPWRGSYVRFLRWTTFNYWKEVVSCLSEEDQRQALAVMINNYYVAQKAQHLLSIFESQGDTVTSGL